MLLSINCMGVTKGPGEHRHYMLLHVSIAQLAVRLKCMKKWLCVSVTTKYILSSSKWIPCLFLTHKPHGFHKPSKYISQIKIILSVSSLHSKYHLSLTIFLLILILQSDLFMQILIEFFSVDLFQALSRWLFRISFTQFFKQQTMLKPPATSCNYDYCQFLGRTLMLPAKPSRKRLWQLAFFPGRIRDSKIGIKNQTKTTLILNPNIVSRH